MNSPVNFNDPTGHMCSDPEDPTPSCDGSGGYPSNIPQPTPPAPGNDGDDDGNDDLEDELGQDGCAYHHCEVETNLYEVGWENFGQAWNIWINPNATYGQQFMAGAYMSYWGGTHVMLVAGGIILSWEIVITTGTRYFTQNPDAARVSLGNFPQYTWTNSTYFDAGKRAGDFLDAVGLLKPMNQQFVRNQMAQLKPMDVTLVREIGRYTIMEMNMLQKSGLYTMTTQTSIDFTGIVHIFEPWIK